MRSPLWWLRRLQAMSIPEVAHRSWRLVRHPIDLLRMRTGRYARVPGSIASWRGPSTFYFVPELARAPVGPALREAADTILAGQRQVLGLGWLTLPDEPWHLEPSAGISWPVIDAARVVSAAPDYLDPRLTWELNRGHEWVVLARVFASTREIQFRDRLTFELASWRALNPIGLGINWVSAMEAAIRIHSFAWVAGFLRATGEEALLETIGAMIYEHAVFVADHLSFGSSANNHLIVELTGLIIAARALHGAGPLATLHRRAIRRLDAEVGLQIFADGVNAEMATHYHAFVLEALLLVAHLERAHGEPRVELERVVTKMADYLEALRCADGSVLQQGDSDDGKIIPLFATNHACQLIAAASTRAVIAAPPAPPPADGEGIYWLTNGATPARPVARVTGSRRFAASGQIVLRSDRLIASFDAGPFGFGSLAAHAHCDSLAINVALDGRRFIVDRGTYRYNGDRTERDRFRMTAAHNTVQVGTREQAEAAGPFLWSRQPTVTIERCELGADGDFVVASHHGFAPWIHRRTLLSHGGILAVIDRVTANAPAAHMRSRLHFAPLLAPRQVPVADGSLIQTAVGWAWTCSADPDLVTTRHSETYCGVENAWTLEWKITPGEASWFVVGPSIASQHERAIGELARFAEDRGVPREAIEAFRRLGEHLCVA